MSEEYINRELLENALEDENKNGNFVFTANWIMEIVDNLPAADVVPKSEVDYLKEHLEMWCNKHKKAREEIERLEAKIAQYQLDLHYSVCREDEARERVATEIFDELEYSSIDGVISINSGYYAELKKKYTGEQT